MMDFTRTSSPPAKLALLSALFLVSFSLYGLYCFNTVSEVKVNGPFYHRIVQGKDVIADILPPPEYLVETYLTAFQMLDDKNGAQLPAFVGKIERLKGEYLSRHAFWNASLPDDELKRALVDGSYAPALRMLDSLEKVFIPALKAGDRNRAEAVLHGSIQEDYAEHRAKIDEVTLLAKRRNHDDEASARIAERARTIGQIVVGLALILMLSSVSWYLVRQNPRLNSAPG